MEVDRRKHDGVVAGDNAVAENRRLNPASKPLDLTTKHRSADPRPGKK